jgi:hypothetical protein
MPMRVVDGPNTSSYHEFIYLQTKDQKEQDDEDAMNDDDFDEKIQLPSRDPTLCFLGSIGSRVTLIPDVKWLCRNGGGVVLDPKKFQNNI